VRYIGVIFSLGCLVTAARANPVTVLFTGTVTQVPVDEVFGDVGVGSAITGFYIFNSLASDGAPADSTTGSYSMFGLPYTFSATVGGHSFSINDFLNIAVFNSFVDQYSVFAQQSGGDLTLEILLQNNSATAFGTDALPLALPSLGNFAQRDFHLTGLIDDGQVQFDGSIDTLQVAPEPASFTLLLIGVAAFGAARLKRSASRVL